MAAPRASQTGRLSDAAEGAPRRRAARVLTPQYRQVALPSFRSCTLSPSRGGVELKVHEIMTPNVISVDEGAPVREVAQLLNRHRISGLPVCDGNGHMVG